MSYEPCSHCGTRYKGSAHSVYLATGEGYELNRRRLKLCPPCGTQASKRLQDDTRVVDLENGLQEPLEANACSKCGITDLQLAVLFATEYEPGEERRDWYARLCDECLGQVVADLDPVPSAVRRAP